MTVPRRYEELQVTAVIEYSSQPGGGESPDCWQTTSARGS